MVQTCTHRHNCSTQTSKFADILVVSPLCEYAIAKYFAYCCIFPAYFRKVRISHIFPHKLAFSTAILILFVFLLAISIRFRYRDNLVANRMAPSVCPDPCGTRRGSWFQAILYHISAA